MDIQKCWELEDTLQVFRIPLRITNPQSNVSIIRFCIFDTGFSGYLGLDKDAIAALNLPQAGTGKTMTVKGLMDYKNYEGTGEIVDAEQKILQKIKNLDSPEDNSQATIIIQEFNFPILGMKSICQFSWLILSEKKIICLLE